MRTSTSARGLDFQLEWSFLANIPLILLTGVDILKHLHFSAEWEILNPFVSLTILYTAKKAHHKVQCWQQTIFIHHLQNVLYPISSKYVLELLKSLCYINPFVTFVVTEYDDSIFEGQGEVGIHIVTCCSLQRLQQIYRSVYEDIRGRSKRTKLSR